MSAQVLPHYPPISDEEITWAARLLKLQPNAFHGEDGTDPRQQILKSMDTIDVAACPGSGKTTLLVAKLAIIADKWQHRTRGICALSHTNVARSEIERRLSNTTAGRRLLSYPHYIGTIHAFVNEFVALPWLRRNGYPITMIDTEICEARRWRKLPFKTRGYLEKQNLDQSSFVITDTSFNVAKKVGKLKFGSDTETYNLLREACTAAAKDGYHCYDDMFVWAHNAVEELPEIVDVIRSRFPLLFVDEAQDNSEEQSRILHRLFQAGVQPVTRQRFGDGNQAIFDSINSNEATTDSFPDEKIEKDLPTSHRFGQRIADFADPLGLIPCGLKGQGPQAKPLASGSLEGEHTVLVFDKGNSTKLLDAYCQLLLETFSDQELLDGVFTAVGQVHRPPLASSLQCSSFLAGKNRRVSTKEESLARAKDIAEDWYLRLRGKISTGEVKAEKTFREVSEYFLREYEIITLGERSKQHVIGQHSRSRGHLVPFFGKMDISKVTTGKILDYRLHRHQQAIAKRGRPPARSTMHKEIVTLRQILKTATRHGWLDRLPDFSEPYRPSLKISHRAWFSPEEYEKLCEATRKRALEPKKRGFNWEGEQLHDYVLFAGHTGLRPDEARRLEFRDVKIVDDEDLGETILEIEVRGKRGFGYCKSMPDAVRPFERLKARLRPRRAEGGRASTEMSDNSDVREQEWRSPGPTDLIFPKWPRELFKTILEEENLRSDRDGRSRTAYSLRHTYISMRLMAGANIYQIAKNCRTSVEMIEKYYAVHIKNSLDAAAINVVRSGKDVMAEEG